MRKPRSTLFELALQRCTLCAVILCCGNTSGQVNNWTKPTSGYWEEPYWSLGQLPSATQSIQVTNSGFRALAIGTVTRAQYPQSLTISNLIVSAPPNSGNLLLLNYPALQTPLRVINSFDLGPNGHLLALYARLQVEGRAGGAFYISGPVMHGEFSEVTASNIFLGYAGPGTYNLTNGLLSEYALRIGSNAVATFNQYGGTHRFNSLDLLGAEAGPASYNFFGGQLQGGTLGIQYDTPEFLPTYRTARFTQSGGVLTLTNLMALGRIGAGTFVLSQGIVTSPTIDVGLPGGNGEFSQSGGTNVCPALNVGTRGVPGFRGFGTYALSNGTLITHTVSVGGFDGIGLFSQSGGTHRGEDISLRGDDYDSHGNYILGGGMLSATALRIGPAGGMLQEGGTNAVAGSVSLTDGFYNFRGGWLSASNVSLLKSRDGSAFYQSGGIAWIANELLVGRDCLFNLQGGILIVSNVLIAAATFGFRSAEMNQSGGVILNAGTFTLDGGLFSTVGQSESLGRLRVSGPASQPSSAGNPAIRLASNACTVRFADSHNELWQPGASLDIFGWNGSTNGGGGTQLIFGNSAAALTRQQVAQITFDQPAGFPPGRYPAHILDTGEVVPAYQPILTFHSSAQDLVLNWPAGFTLQTATNVTGPYVDLADASPYTQPLTEPQRFFRLRR